MNQEVFLILIIGCLLEDFFSTSLVPGSEISGPIGPSNSHHRAITCISEISSPKGQSHELVNERRTQVEVFDSVSLSARRGSTLAAAGRWMSKCQHVHQQRFILSPSRDG
jgi:hypothetical protein